MARDRYPDRMVHEPPPRAERADRMERRDHRDRMERREGRERYGVSLDEAVERVRRETGARILSAETREAEGGSQHVIKILTEKGRVRRVRVDPRTGNRIRRR